ncbi:MAG: phytoene/squalene synthase family protein [Bdellovibrionales bacterium]|nr:phytoene/squalene synthase family protein [Ramlibacter sp.]
MTQQAQADLAACRASLREGSYTFFAASLILPRSVREPASALYAFCRMADDAVDNGADPQAAVAALRARLDDAYSGRPQFASADRALAAVVSHFALPRALPDALIEGFVWDCAGRRYETLADLQDYASRVAGSVGAMMAVVMGVRSPEGLARACDLGVAMQLSNIARDVGEDARMGRLYLPLQWLREEGVDPEAWLANPVFNPQIAAVVQRLLAAADALYERVGAGVAQLPAACRPGINAARFLYAAIGHEVARRGMDSVSQRAVVGRSRKLGLLALAMVSLRPARADQPAPCLPANRYLVDAAALQSQAPVRQAFIHQTPVQQVHAQDAPAWWRVDSLVSARAVWVIDLFERLERRDALARAAGGSLAR